MRTNYCGELQASHIDKNVTLYGWVDRCRDHGGVIFIDLRYRSGVVQIASNPIQTPDSYPIAEGLHNEYVIKIT